MLPVDREHIRRLSKETYHDINDKNGDIAK